jgi:hypothetical protein
MSQARLRVLEGELNTLKETAELLGTNVARVWDWRQASNELTTEECDVLETYLVGKLARYEFLVTRGCAGRVMA